MMFICFWNFNLHFILLSLKFLTDIRTGKLASKTFQMCSLQSSMSCPPLYLFLFIYFILTARLVYSNGDYIIIGIIFKRNRRSCNGIAITIHVFGENTGKYGRIKTIKINFPKMYIFIKYIDKFYGS